MTTQAQPQSRSESPSQVQAVVPTGCCPPFDPSLWDGKEVVWRNKPFVHEQVRSFMHVPLNMGRKVTRQMALIDAAHATTEQPMMLADDASPWSSDLYIAVAKDVPGAEMRMLSGRFLTKVFEGPYRDAGKWMEEMKGYVARKGHKLEKILSGYTMCPRCAKAYGKNYTVLFAKVSEEGIQHA